MKEYVEEYIKYLQEQNPFLLNNYNYMVAFAKNLIDSCDDATYYWLKQSSTENLSNKNLTSRGIISVVHNTLRELSADVGNEFLADVKSGKIKFINSGNSTSKFSAIRSSETRELEDYEIIIQTTKTITDLFHLIHEYTHKVMEKINVSADRNKDHVDIYDEAAAIFAELLLAKRLSEKYPELKEDIKLEIGTRINTQINAITGIYETFKVISKVQSGIPEDEIKETCAAGMYTYDSICNRIINKDQGNVGIHFIGLLTAINIFYTSTNLQKDYETIVNEAKQGKYEFLASKVPTIPSEITKYVILMRKSLSDESDKEEKPTIKNP